jgi:hypothetical protein
MAICRHWKRGRCYQGDECGFQHPTERPHELPTSDRGYDEVQFLGHAERMSRVSWPSALIEPFPLSNRARSFANTTRQQGAATTPPPPRPSRPPKIQDRRELGVLESEKQESSVESSGGFMHPERVSRHQAILTWRLVDRKEALLTGQTGSATGGTATQTVFTNERAR